MSNEDSYIEEEEDSGNENDVIISSDSDETQFPKINIELVGFHKTIVVEVEATNRSTASLRSRIAQQFSVIKNENMPSKFYEGSSYDGKKIAEFYTNPENIFIYKGNHVSGLDEDLNLQFNDEDKLFLLPPESATIYRQMLKGE